MRAKKSLGQNFLTSRGVARDIVVAAQITPDDVVLEIGPGKGFLTEGLLQKAKKVIAVEKDERMVEYLKDKFREEIRNGKLELIHQDILSFDISRSTLHTLRFTLVANIPYYITGQFLRKFLSGPVQPSKMVILLQKEVVKRIMANDGKESILSISVKAYGRPKNIGKVSKENFSPRPKVDSAILLIDNISRDFFKEIDEKRFFEIVKAGFAHKRKILTRNIEHLAKNKEQIEEVFKNCGIPPKARAEDLKIEQWKCLSTML